MVIRADQLRRYCEGDAAPPFESPSGIIDQYITGSDAIALRKPTTDEWSSATAGQSDERVLADVCGLPTQTDET